MAMLPYGAGACRQWEHRREQRPPPPGPPRTVKIIPATALRDHPGYFAPQPSAQDPYFYEEPVNAAWYMGYPHGDPYGQGAYVEGYGEYPGYYGQYAYGGYPYNYFDATQPGAYQGGYLNQAYAGPSGGATSGYRAYPQPSPPQRRSRTAPGRTKDDKFDKSPYPKERSATERTHFSQAATATMDRGRSRHPTMRQQQTQQQRGYSADAYRHYSAFTGRWKGAQQQQQPMYRKRATRTEEMRPYEYGTALPGTTLRRLRPYYAPSYATYPPSTMARREQRHSYPLFARAALKLAQLIIGAAILGLVLGPMRATSFHDFVIKTKTEWQGAVVGIVGTFSIFTVIMLATCWMAYKSYSWWRRLDAHISALAAFCMLLAAFIEAYFAACYPPNGAKINLVCHRAEWIIATILLFINVILYIIDFVMAWLNGVSMW